MRSTVRAPLARPRAPQPPAPAPRAHRCPTVARPPVRADEDFEEDMEEDVVDREMLKKQSALILDKATKGKKKRRRRNAAATDDEK